VIWNSRPNVAAASRFAGHRLRGADIRERRRCRNEIDYLFSIRFIFTLCIRNRMDVAAEIFPVALQCLMHVVWCFDVQEKQNF
jgi:hypothetical protein